MSGCYGSSDYDRWLEHQADLMWGADDASDYSEPDDIDPPDDWWGDDESDDEPD